jgi:hypothetical protein
VELLRQAYDDNAMESERHDNIINDYETKEYDRRTSAIQFSRDVQEICPNLKDQNISVHGR